MARLLQDFRYAFRFLVKSRGFTAAAIVVLALGIGANTAIFSVVNRVLIRPLPFPDSDRLVEVFHTPPPRAFPGITRFDVSPANYLDWRATAKSFDGMAAFAARQVTLTGDRPEVVRAAFVGGDFFHIMRLATRIGRPFNNDDDQPGRPHVAVISDGFWKSHYGGSPDALGKTLLVNGEPFSIIGVAPPTLHYAAWASIGAAEIWMPLAWNAENRAVRHIHNFLVLARLKRGVTISQAQAEMNTISKQLEAQYPKDDREWGAVVIWLRDDLVNGIRPVLLVLLGAVAFVLLIACANVANLVTARNLARRKEIALRAALGASRGRTLQQLLVESMLLSVAGGLAGLALARLATPLLARFVNQQFTIEGGIPLDVPVLLFTLGITLATGILAGLWPAWRGTRAELNEALKQTSGRGASDGGARRTRGALVAVEVAFSLMLLAGAGLMVRSLWLLTGVDPGFDPKNVLTLTVSFGYQQLPPDQQASQTAAFYRRVLERVRALPGVESAGLISGLPFRGGGVQPFTIEGRPVDNLSQQPTAAVRSISPGYLRTMRIPLLKGRDVNEADTADRQHVVLISNGMAQKFWPGEDPIGRHLTLSFNPKQPALVVGITGDVKQRGLDASGPPVTIYEAESPETNWPMSLAIRSKAQPEALTAPVTVLLREMSPDRPVRDVETMQAIVDQSISDRRMSMILLVAFAGLALLLAGFGLYSVISYSMRRRMREIGIRIALGARRRDVLGMAAIDTLWPTAAGIAAGIGGAWLLSTLLSGLLFGVRPRDPLTFAAVSLILALAAVAASIVPAWRATRVDPLQVLREE